MSQSNSRGETSEASHRWCIALVLFLGIAVFYLLAEHWAHTIYVLPWLLLLACPLLHFWHHGGHGHASHEQATQPPPPVAVAFVTARDVIYSLIHDDHEAGTQPV